MKRTGLRVFVLVLVLAVAAAGFTKAASQENTTAAPALLRSTFGKLPIYFIENRGVHPDEVSFYVTGSDKTLYFTKEGITFRLKGEDKAWVVKLEFVGANPVTPRGEDPQEAIFSYFKGPKKDWKTGLRTYSRVVYEDLWPGIDLIYRGTVNRLKYEFQVKPGADPSTIRLRYRGVESLERTRSGSLAVKTPAGGFEDAPPEAWQEIDGRRVPVEMGYRLDAEVPGNAGSRSPCAGEGTSFGFRVGEYDATKPLVLDPAVLVYCGYIGGSGRDGAEGLVIDAAGNAYVAGWTFSTEQTFPVVVGPDLTFNSGEDAFVAKISFCDLAVGGASRIGSTALLLLHASDSPGLPYQVGSSLGTGPIPLGIRQIDLSPDNLLVVSAGNLWPWIFSNYRGVLDSQGQAQAAIHIPNLPALIGLRIHSAFVTLDPTAPWGIRSISDTESFTITK